MACKRPGGRVPLAPLHGVSPGQNLVIRPSKNPSPSALVLVISVTFRDSCWSAPRGRLLACPVSGHAAPFRRFLAIPPAHGPAGTSLGGISFDLQLLLWEPFREPPRLSCPRRERELPAETPGRPLSG